MLVNLNFTKLSPQFSTIGRVRRVDIEFASTSTISDVNISGNLSQTTQNSLGSLNVFGSPKLQVSGVWLIGKSTSNSTFAFWDATHSVNNSQNAVYKIAGVVTDSRSLTWKSIDKRLNKIELLWSVSVQKSHAAQINWSWPAFNDRQYVMPWGDFKNIELSTFSRWLHPTWHATEWLLPFKQGKFDTTQKSMPWDAETEQKRLQYVTPWAAGMPPKRGQGRVILPVVVEEEPVIRHRIRADLNFCKLKPVTNSNIHTIRADINFTRELGCLHPIGAYIVNNSVFVKTLIDGQNVNVTGGSCSSNIGSSVWEIELDFVEHSVYERLVPRGVGRQEIEVSVNGYTFRGIVESVSSSVAFGQRSYKARARSFSVYAMNPYSKRTNFVSEFTKTASQLANDAVFGIADYLVVWNAVDWSIPSKLLNARDAAALDIVGELASSIQAIIVPHRFLPRVDVISRFVVSPWSWKDTIPLKSVPLSQQIRTSSSFEPSTFYNKIYVSPTESGVMYGCTRHNTSGDSLKQMVTHPLLVTLPAASERGRVELCKSGNWITTTFVSPIMSIAAGGFGLLELMDYVTLQGEETESTMRGQITGISVNFSLNNEALVVYQSVTMEAYRE